MQAMLSVSDLDMVFELKRAEQEFGTALPGERWMDVSFAEDIFASHNPESGSHVAERASA